MQSGRPTRSPDVRRVSGCSLQWSFLRLRGEAFRAVAVMEFGSGLRWAMLRPWGWRGQLSERGQSVGSLVEAQLIRIAR